MPVKLMRSPLFVVCVCVCVGRVGCWVDTLFCTKTLLHIWKDLNIILFEFQIPLSRIQNFHYFKLFCVFEEKRKSPIEAMIYLTELTVRKGNMDRLGMIFNISIKTYVLTLH